MFWTGRLKHVAIQCGIYLKSSVNCARSLYCTWCLTLNKAKSQQKCPYKSYKLIFFTSFRGIQYTVQYICKLWYTLLCLICVTGLSSCCCAITSAAPVGTNFFNQLTKFAVQTVSLQELWALFTCLRNVHSLVVFFPRVVLPILFCHLIFWSVFSLLFYGIYEVSYVCTEVYDAAKATNNYFTVTSFVTYFSDWSVHGVDYQVSKIIKSIKTCRGPRSGRQNTHRLLIF